MQFSQSTFKAILCQNELFRTFAQKKPYKMEHFNFTEHHGIYSPGGKKNKTPVYKMLNNLVEHAFMSLEWSRGFCEG